MALSQVSLNSLIVSQAYSRSLLFDKMKKKQDGVSGAEVETQTEATPTEQTLADALPKEKPKPNTVPFKTGFVFEYAENSEKGPISITISDQEKVKVELQKAADSDDRKHTIRSLVMLGLGKLARDDFNNALVQGKNSIENIKSELSLMGLNTGIPFSLGENAFYINAKSLLSSYKPMDIKA